MPTIEEFVHGRYAAKEDKPPADDRSAIGAAYQDYVGGPARDFVTNLLAGGMRGNPLNDLVAGMVPETTTQAGMLAGTMLAPELRAGEAAGSVARNAPKLLPALERILGPALGGTAGGLAEKGDPGDALVGGVLGTVTGVGVEAGSTLSKWFSKAPLARRFYREDPQRLGRVVNGLVKDFPQMQTPEEFGSAVWQGVAQDKLSEMYDHELSAVSRAVTKESPAGQPPLRAADFGGGPEGLTKFREAMRGRASMPHIDNGQITSPRIGALQSQGVIGPKSDFDSLAQAVRDLRLKGRASDGDPKMTLQGRQARDYASDLSDDIAAALDTSVGKGAARRYVNMDKRYARGAEMLRYLKQPGVVDENGRLDMRLLQDQLKSERGIGLAHDFTPEEMQQLTDAVFRGGPATVTDIMAKNPSPHLRVHAGEGGMPKASLFANLMDMLRGNDFAGSYELGFPYVPPRAASIGTQLLGAGALHAADKPISLRKPSSSGDD